MLAVSWDQLRNDNIRKAKGEIFEKFKKTPWIKTQICYKFNINLQHLQRPKCQWLCKRTSLLDGQLKSRFIFRICNRRSLHKLLYLFCLRYSYAFEFMDENEAVLSGRFYGINGNYTPLLTGCVVCMSIVDKKLIERRNNDLLAKEGWRLIQKHKIFLCYFRSVVYHCRQAPATPNHLYACEKWYASLSYRFLWQLIKFAFRQRCESTRKEIRCWKSRRSWNWLLDLNYYACVEQDVDRFVMLPIIYNDARGVVDSVHCAQW